MVSLLAALVATGDLAGCSHEATPVVQPDDHPPLPPASGTPIGYLVEGADQFAATDEQRTQLEDIDRDLAAHLAARDHELRTTDPVAPEDRHVPANQQNFGVGTSNASGSGPNVANGGAIPGSAPPTRRFLSDANRPTQAPVTREIIVSPDAVEGVKKERASDTRVAIRRAFKILSADQQTIAKRILIEHGVDPETGMIGADPAAPKPADQ